MDNHHVLLGKLTIDIYKYPFSIACSHCQRAYLYPEGANIMAIERYRHTGPPYPPCDALARHQKTRENLEGSVPVFCDLLCVTIGCQLIVINIVIYGDLW